MIHTLTLKKMFLSTFCALLLFSFNLTAAYESYRFKSCGSLEEDIYTKNSLFSVNLAQALKNIRTSAALTGFNITTVGNGTELVAALGLCRPDLTPVECQECIDSAASGVLEACPNRKKAQIWYTVCMIHYSFMNFLSLVNRTPMFCLSTDSETSSSDLYYQTWLPVLKNISSVGSVSARQYAVGWSTVNGSMKVYGYVQCTPDLSGESCSSCLLSVIKEISSECWNKWECWCSTPSCYAMFNRYPVLNQSIDTPEILLNLASTTDSVTKAAEASKTGRPGRSSMVVGLSVAVVGAVVMTVATWWFFMRGRQNTKKGQRKGSGDGGEDTEESMGKGLGMRNFLYDMEALVAATDNFSSANQLGGGGFGFVYKGTTQNGEEIAVKKLTVGSMQGVEEFSNEVEVLMKMKHRNLVKLLGCCTQGGEKMLVYEYLPNKSLNYFLFDKARSSILNWRIRCNIIVGVARGLLYLHEDSQIRIIHRDIKASNILLDEHMNPKISDFGLAKLFPDGQNLLRTHRIAGTVGYMAPEYAIRGLMSEKTDVFSFGVLMLEIISGRKNYEPLLDDDKRELLYLTMRLERQGRLVELVDPTIGSFPENEVKKYIHIGFLCCQESIQERLTMSSALRLILNDPVNMPPLGRLGFQGSRDNTIESSASDTSSPIAVLGSGNVSNNTITTSLIIGR